MTLWNKNELLEALSTELLNHNLPEKIEIDEVVIDSRKTPKSGLFVALKGEKNDAHDFVKQAAENGCKVAIVSREVEGILQLLVKDTFVALYKLAEFSRKRSKARIIAITGSVGKTGTKEMLKLVFESQGKTFATSGNLNNHIGVPLSLSNFSCDCDYGIFEMGMNHANEIEPLSKLVSPHLAVITNIGPVHIEFFKDEEGIALAKSEIFSGLDLNGIALINADNKHYALLQKRAKFSKIKDQNLISFGEKKSADYQILDFKIIDAAKTQVRAKLKNTTEISYEIATSTPAIIFNSIIVVSALDLLGRDLKLGISCLKNITTPKGRGKVYDVKIGQGNFAKNITIIDDSYNASVLSMYAGIEHLAMLKKILSKKRVVVALGDMLELGEKSVELHEEVTNYLKTFHIDFAVMVGERMTQAAKKLPTNSYKTFSTSNEASQQIEDLLQDGDIIYLKGSRGIKMENVVKNLTTQNSAH